jgi:dnd system-associated protein 4
MSLEEIYSQPFKFEKSKREGIMRDYSTTENKDKYKPFSYLWQCFAWAAILGFINKKREPLIPPIADKPFDLNTMKNNGGETIAKALTILAISKSKKGIEILKSPDEFRILIEEYANGGFNYIEKLIANEQFDFNSHEKFLLEIQERKP